ncbi:MAG TPA: YaaC family protein [Paraburkholderia sp.]|uniref:YaaC family protein n=1 Tax=Paraburkholderia sp. TaxID=1926495 RepID=UPI002B47300F|nr:YaaC family protein [Paraburkholderia sp.]HKR40083.1 YaaC family protein [Paraburkholderia sp.]
MSQSHNLQFLESTNNLSSVIQRKHGWRPNVQQTQEILACIRQGRLFYEASASSPIEIRPLQQFYGMLGFAKALILVSDRKNRLGNLAGSHALKDTSAPDSQLAELSAKITGRGTFHYFNDAVAARNKLRFVEAGSNPQSTEMPCARSDSLEDLTINLQALLSRIPGLEDLYENTFQERANCASFFLHSLDQDSWILQVTDSDVPNSRDQLRAIVNGWRERYPFLRQWRLAHVEFAWGKTNLQFANSFPVGDDLDDRLFIADLITYSAHPDDLVRTRFNDFSAHMSPCSGGLDGTFPYLVSPIGGHVVAEYALQYVALFILSSLVRYRPQTWMHSLSRTAMGERRADDAPLALIERLMDINQTKMPILVDSIINPA